MKIVFLILLTVTGFVTAAPIPITVNSVSGDTNSFQGNFSLSWNAIPVDGNASGTWAGGTFNFIFGIGGTGNPDDFLYDFTIQTFWNDGWIPGGLEYVNYIGIGSGNGALGSLTDTSIVATDYSGLELQYYLTSDASHNLTINSDTSGMDEIVVDLSRMAVAESGSTLTLLLLGGVWLALIEMLRRETGRAT
jgi:hypothetical protein